MTLLTLLTEGAEGMGLGTGYAEWRGWGYCGRGREEFLKNI